MSVMDNTVNSIVNNLSERIGDVTPKIQNVAETVIIETSRLAGVQCVIGYGISVAFLLAGIGSLILARHTFYRERDNAEKKNRPMNTNGSDACCIIAAILIIAALFVIGVTTTSCLPEYLAPTKTVINDILMRTK